MRIYDTARRRDYYDRAQAWFADDDIVYRRDPRVVSLGSGHGLPGLQEIRDQMESLVMLVLKENQDLQDHQAQEGVQVMQEQQVFLARVST